MKTLWKLSKEALRYKKLYLLAITATLSLTLLNLAAPRVLSAMTGIVKDGVTAEKLTDIKKLTIILIGLYLLRIVFRFMSS